MAGTVNRESSGSSVSDAAVTPLCLEFANTVLWRRSPRPVDVIADHPALLAWAARVGAQDDTAEGPPRTGSDTVAEQRALDAARDLRESVFRTFAAVAHGEQPHDVDLAAITGVLAGHLASAHLRHVGAGYAWDWDAAGDRPDGMLGPVALSAVELLTAGPLERVGQCPGPDCGWLFLDTTRSRTRRWCSPMLCGNRARVRSHYERTRGRTNASHPGTEGSVEP